MNSITEESAFWRYTLNRRWSNASLIKHRNFDGHIVSMQQSGSHWIKNILSGIFVRIYDLPEMKHIQDDSIIGHTKSPPIYDHIPQIVHSHGYPHALSLRIPFLHFPKYLFLVRDLKDSLVSHYERFKGDYDDVDFATYLKGDLRQKRFHSDIYSRIRFMNEWGHVIQRRGDAVHTLTYEGMKKDPFSEVRKVCDFFGIEGATDDIIKDVIAENSKEQMANKPANPEVNTTVVRTSGKTTEDHFTFENQKIFDQICGLYLIHDFGYGYPTRS